MLVALIEDPEGEKICRDLVNVVDKVFGY